MFLIYSELYLHLQLVIIYVYINVNKNNAIKSINHPPIITIVIGGPNHSQMGWYYGIVLPTSTLIINMNCIELYLQRIYYNDSTLHY